MKFAAWAVTFALLLLGGAVTFAILRGKDTRDRLRIVERGPATECVDGDKRACRALARALRDAVRPTEGRKRDPDPTDKSRADSRRGISPAVIPGGGDATGPPSGGGPTGRVPSPGSPPPRPTPPSPSPPERKPLIDLKAPVPLETCVGNLLGVNCP